MNKFKNQIMMLLTGSLALAMTLNQHVHAQSDEAVNEPAGRSTELVVDPEFNFNSSRKVTLDITVRNDLNQRQSGVLIKVFAVEDPKRVVGVKRKLKTTLISVLRSDDNGNVQREVEIPQHYRDLRIEKQAMSSRPAKDIVIDNQEKIFVKL